MADENDRVRERAYFLWLEEGCPEGQAERHWRAAKTILEAASERTPIEGEPRRRTRGRIPDRPCAFGHARDVADPSVRRVPAGKNL